MRTKGTHGPAPANPLEFVRVSAVLPKNIVDELREHAAKKGDNLTQGLKGAISTKNFLEREVADGSTIIVQRKEGALVQVRLP
jgi:4-aminobutyrate aminotransferase-like enzyme